MDSVSFRLFLFLNSAGLKYGSHLQNAPNQHGPNGRSLLKQGGPPKTEEEEESGKGMFMVTKSTQPPFYFYRL
jgi:hypothetical protein